MQTAKISEVLTAWPQTHTRTHLMLYKLNLDVYYDPDGEQGGGGEQLQEWIAQWEYRPNKINH